MRKCEEKLKDWKEEKEKECRDLMERIRQLEKEKVEEQNKAKRAASQINESREDRD